MILDVNLNVRLPENQTVPKNSSYVPITRLKCLLKDVQLDMLHKGLGRLVQISHHVLKEEDKSGTRKTEFMKKLETITNQNIWATTAFFGGGAQNKLERLPSQLDSFAICQVKRE